MIHSSSATIGIVMGLGAAGILDWQTAVAFSLGADLGTTITSWIASLNLSKNAKRAAYAHIAFNIIGVSRDAAAVLSLDGLLTWVMGFFGGDPGVPVIVDGKETFPLVPVAVGSSRSSSTSSTPRCCSRSSASSSGSSRASDAPREDVEDFSVPRFLDPALGDRSPTGVPPCNARCSATSRPASCSCVARRSRRAQDDARTTTCASMRSAARSAATPRRC